MYGRVKVYLERGLRDIVRVQYDWTEEPRVDGEENTFETFIARGTDGEHVKFSVHTRRTFRPPRPPECKIGPAKVITVDEYESLRDGKPVLDTPQFIERFDLEQAIDNATPSCIRCSKRMKLRSGKRGYFWGCSTYPRCNEVATLSAEVVTLYDRLRELESAAK